MGHWTCCHPVLMSGAFYWQLVHQTGSDRVFLSSFQRQCFSVLIGTFCVCSDMNPSGTFQCNSRSLEERAVTCDTKRDTAAAEEFTEARRRRRQEIIFILIQLQRYGGAVVSGWRPRVKKWSWVTTAGFFSRTGKFCGSWVMAAVTMTQLLMNSLSPPAFPNKSSTQLPSSELISAFP